MPLVCSTCLFVQGCATAAQSIADVVIIAKAKEFLAGELGTIVGDDTVWHSEAMDGVCEEEDVLT
jgi:hypothetical protein